SNRWPLQGLLSWDEDGDSRASPAGRFEREPARQIGAPRSKLWSSFFHVPFQRARADFSAINITLRVGCDAFCGAGSGELGTLARFRVGNECEKRAVFSAADANAAFPAVVIT